MTLPQHPREHIGCLNCDDGGHKPTREFKKYRRLKQIGWTYVCQTCEMEHYVYNAGNNTQRWEPVTDQVLNDLPVTYEP